MYYLYQKKQKEEGSAATVVDASSAAGQPVTVHSPSSSHHDHHDRHNTDTNLDNEGATAMTSGEHSVPKRPGLNRRGRPGAMSETDESKQKDEQLVRRMLRRRGLEEHDFTEEVMQPLRPQRVACQRCQHDIATNDSRHRIICTGPENHVFCKHCVTHYVEEWMRGESSCELRQNKAGPLTGLYALPCLTPSCQQGCFTEVHLQPLVESPMFVALRQKISFERSRENRGRPLRAVLTMPGSTSSQPPPREQGQDDHLQTSHSLAPPPLLHHQQQQHYQHNIHAQPTQFHRHPYEQQQMNPQRLTQERDNQLYERQQYQFQQQQQHSMQRQQQDQRQLMQHQRMLEERRQHQQMLDQQQNMLQDHSRNAPAPLPPALRRSSTASTAKTTTTKSVRFAFKGDLDMDGLLDDLVSLASSNSSLTTRFPVSLSDQQHDPDEDPSEDKQQLHLQQPPSVPQEQLTSQDQSALQVSVHPSFFTCQCCYEEFDATKSLKTSCDPRKPSTESHIFCGKCFRLYIEEWLFGGVTYALRPGMSNDDGGKTVLVVPCLFGDCKGGGFSDERVSQSLSPRMLGQYLEKISSLRVDEEEQEEKLVKMAIHLSLEQDEIQKKVNRMLDDQQSLAKEGIPVTSPPSTQSRHMHLPPSELHVPMTDLSCASSLTSFNTAFQHTTVSAPGLGSMKYANSKVAASTKKLASKKQSLHQQRIEKLEKCVHDVEEAMTSAKIRQCPNCNTKFLKDKDFCNKLKCPSCKIAICYMCRHVIPSQGYEHFCIHKQGGCGDCLGLHCPLWTVEDDDDQRDLAAMRARGLDEANRIWENSLTDGQLGVEIRVDVDKLLQQPPEPDAKHMAH